MSTQRLKLTIAYRGTKFHGWQAQPLTETFTGVAPPPGQGVPTIQETLTRVMAGVLGHPVSLSGSSRTDRGVHAKGQVAHTDTDKIQIPIEGLRRAVNHRLPSDIILKEIEVVPDAFDAVRSTSHKRYQYVIWNDPDRPVFFDDLAWHRWFDLDADRMNEAAKFFIGQHDYVSFARPGHGRAHTVRTILDCSVSRRGPRIVIGVEGKGFLWNMVRIMVGTLVHVGLGKHRPEAIKAMLEAKDRTAAGPTAPAHGLYLQWIRFKPMEQILAEYEVERALAAERAAAKAAREAVEPAAVVPAAPAVIVDDDDGDPDA